MWWRERQTLRKVARDLTREFEASHIDGIGFAVKAHGVGRLELLVWPEAGLDNFVEPAKGREAIERAADEFRRIVSMYASGRRPPF